MVRRALLAVLRGVPLVRESHLASRVLDALLRENYGDLSAQITRGRGGVGLTLADGRLVRLAPGLPFQDFVVAPGQVLGLEQVLDTLAEIAPEEDADGVKAFFDECAAALAALELHDALLPEVLSRDLSYETMAAFADHPGYPTARARTGMPEGEVAAFAPEFGEAFELRWAAVPGRLLEPGSAAGLPGDVMAALTGGEPVGELRDGEVLFPVHPLAVDAVREAGARVLDGGRGLVRTTASMRAVEVGPGTQLVLPLPVTELGVRDSLGMGPGRLEGAARAEGLLREPADPGVVVAGEQEYARAGHDQLAWMVRRLPDGVVVPVTALTLAGACRVAGAPDAPGWTVAAPGAGADVPGRDTTAPGVPGRDVKALSVPGREVAAPGGPEVAGAGVPRLHGVLADHGGVEGVLASYLRILLRWSVRLLVEHGIVPPVRWHDVAVVLGDGTVRVLVRGHDAVLAPAGTDGLPERMVTDDPHAPADAFVTGVLHLGAAAVAFAVLPAARAAEMLRGALEEALRPYEGHPKARLLRARTLDAARLTGRPWLTAGTLASAARLAAGMPRLTGPNYLVRRHG